MQAYARFADAQMAVAAKANISGRLFDGIPLKVAFVTDAAFAAL
jgi:hypothetical protein